MLRKIFKCLAGAMYAGVLAYAIGSWAICDAYITRGYEAAGGEYFLFPAVFFVAYEAIQFSYKVLEGDGFQGIRSGWERAAEYMGRKMKAAGIKKYEVEEQHEKEKPGKGAWGGL